MKTFILTSFSLMLIAAPLQAALTVIFGNDIGGNTFLRDIAGVRLTTGPKGQPGNGAVIQVGYYTLATTSNPFAGDWVPLIGPGTGIEGPNIGESTSGFVGSGLFRGSVILGANHPGSVVYPIVGTQLAIRFYDGTTIAGSTHYNAVSMADWTWLRPSAGDRTLILAILSTSSTAMIWEGGPESAYRTTLPNVVPEPSVFLVSLIGGGAFIWRRKRC